VVQLFTKRIDPAELHVIGSTKGLDKIQWLTQPFLGDIMTVDIISLFRSAKEWASLLSKEDRSLFFQLAKNNPGTGAAISNPENNGFVNTNCYWEDLREHVIQAPEAPTNRRKMFEDIISLVHKVSAVSAGRRGFAVYIGRTFYRREREQSGPRARWRREEHRYGKVLFKLPRNSVERNEALGIALVGFWSENWNRKGNPALCCYNKVLGANGQLSSDRIQLIYLCLGKRGGWARKKIRINKTLLDRLKKLGYGGRLVGGRGRTQNTKTKGKVSPRWSVSRWGARKVDGYFENSPGARERAKQLSENGGTYYVRLDGETKGKYKDGKRLAT
jgi:hypothetical protein